MNRLKIFDLSFCDPETPQQTNLQGGQEVTSVSQSYSYSNGAGNKVSSAFSRIRFNNRYSIAGYAVGAFNSAAAGAAANGSKLAFLYAKVFN